MPHSRPSPHAGPGHRRRRRAGDRGRGGGHRGRRSVGRRHGIVVVATPPSAVVSVTCGWRVTSGRLGPAHAATAAEGRHEEDHGSAHVHRCYGHASPGAPGERRWEAPGRTVTFRSDADGTPHDAASGRRGREGRQHRHPRGPPGVDLRPPVPVEDRRLPHLDRGRRRHRPAAAVDLPRHHRHRHPGREHAADLDADRSGRPGGAGRRRAGHRAALVLGPHR